MDAALRRVLAGVPDATVVALGEGFETQFWRVDDGRLRWLALDLPEVVAVRREVLPDGPRNRTLAGSAAGDGVDCPGRPGTAGDHHGPGSAAVLRGGARRHRLLTAWARLLPGAWLLFDAVTAPLQAVRRRNPLPGGYRPPDWTWTVDTGELRRLRELPGLTDLHEVPQAGGDRLPGVLRRVPGLKSQLPAFGVPGAARPRRRIACHVALMKL